MHLPVLTRPRTGAGPRAPHWALVLLSALLACAACLFTSPAPAHAAGDDVTWTVRTASNDYGDDRSSFSYTVNPGGEIRDTMVVANKGTKPLTLTLYAADGFTTDKGGLDVLTRDKKSTGVGAWLKASAPSVTIKAGASADVPFTVHPPKNATPGDHVGALLTSLRQPDAGAGVNVDRRLGIRVKVRVSGPLKPALTVEDLHVDYDGSAQPFARGDATVTYTLHNTGNAMLSGRQKVRVEGPFGTLGTDAAAIAAPPQLLPGERWKVTVKAPDVAPALRLTTTATVTPVLTDEAGSTTLLDPVTASTTTWAIPWTLLALLLLLLAVAVAAVLLLRRTRRRNRRREDERVREAVAQALRTGTPSTREPDGETENTRDAPGPADGAEDTDPAAPRRAGGAVRRTPDAPASDGGAESGREPAKSERS